MRRLSPTGMAAAVLALCFALNMIGRGVGDAFIVFLLPLANDFGWRRAEVASVFSIYLLTSGLVSPVTGYVFDRWGPRVVYPAGIACVAVMCLAAPRLSSLWQFQLVLGVIAGIGVSTLGMVPASSLISRWFRSNMSTAIAVVYAGFGSGALVVAPLAQYLIETRGWRSAYELMGFAVAALLPLLAFLPWKVIREGHPEYARLPRTGEPKENGAAASPLRNAVRTPAYWLLAQVFFFTSLGMYTVLVQLVAFLVDLGFTPLEAASAFGISGALGAAGMVAAGWFADRIGFRPTATATFVGTLTGIGVLIALFHGAPHALLPLFVLFFGICQGARGPIISSLCARLFPGRGFATIYGTIFVFASLGSALGSWISGVMHDLTGGYLTGLVFSCVCILLALAPFWISNALTGRRS